MQTCSNMGRAFMNCRDLRVPDTMLRICVRKKKIPVPILSIGERTALLAKVRN